MSGVAPSQRTDGGSAPENGADDRDFETMDFEAIENAVVQTERGRWFLREYARRIRESDQTRVEAALARIESRLPPTPNPVREAETRIVALSVHQRLLDLARALRKRGVDEESCARIEAQAEALIELARRRDLIDAGARPAGAKPLPAA